MNIAVLLAGGSGSRMHSRIAKQHIVIDNHQIIEYTLRAFSSCEKITSIYIVANPNYIELNQRFMVTFPKLRDIFCGGNSRILSVYNAIQHLNKQCDDNDKIIISDAVRPCITIREMEELLNALDHYDAATTGVEIYETILKINDERRLENIIQRDGIYRQTSPEAYRFSALRRLYIETSIERVKEYNNIGIDQMYADSIPVGIVQSSPLNFKITTEADLYYFETVIKKGFDAIIHGD